MSRGPWYKTLLTKLTEDEAHLITSTFATGSAAQSKKPKVLLPVKEGSCTLRLSFTCATADAEKIREMAEANRSYNRIELYPLTTFPITGHSWEVTSPSEDRLLFNYDNTQRIEVGPDLTRLGPVQFKFKPSTGQASASGSALAAPTPPLPWQHLLPYTTRILVHDMSLLHRKMEPMGETGTTEMVFTFRGDLWRDGQLADPSMPKHCFKPFYGVQAIDDLIQAGNDGGQASNDEMQISDHHGWGVDTAAASAGTGGMGDVTCMWGRGGLLAKLPDADYSNTEVPRKED